MSLFVMKAIKGSGWRIWNTKMKYWWGKIYQNQPTALIIELNGQRRSNVLEQLQRKIK